MSAIVNLLAAPPDRGSSAGSGLIATKLLESTVARLIPVLDQAGHGQLVAALSSSRPRRPGAWQPALGIGSAASRTGHQLLGALHLMSMMQPEAPFELTVPLDRPGTLYLDGHLLPVGHHVTVTADLTGLQFKSQGATAKLESETGQWLLANVEGGLRAVRPFARRIARYVAISSVKGSSSVFPDPMRHSPLGAEPSGPLEGDLLHVEAALSALAGSANEQLQWLEESVDGLLLVSGEAAALSSPDFPGLLALAPGKSVPDYIEAIAGGACHQKLFQLALVSALTKPGREEVHYVPARRSYTTTRRALAAAHEHVNVIGTLRGLTQRPSPWASSLLERIERRRLMLAIDCVPALDSSAILTEAGSLLWRRLQDVANATGPKADAWPSNLEESVAAECGV